VTRELNWYFNRKKEKEKGTTVLGFLPEWVPTISAILFVVSALAFIAAFVLWRAAVTTGEEMQRQMKGTDMFPKDPVTGKRAIDERVLGMGGGGIVLGMGSIGCGGCGVVLWCVGVLTLVVLPLQGNNV